MTTLAQRWQVIRTISFRSPAVLWLVGLAFAYLLFAVWANQLTFVLPRMLNIRPGYAAASSALLLIIAFLFGINATLVAHQFKLRSTLSKHGGLMAGGIAASLIGSACPACAVGLFPLLASLFGTSLSLASLPLFGLEFSILAVLLLAFSLWLLTNAPERCPIPLPRSYGKKSAKAKSAIRG